MRIIHVSDLHNESESVANAGRVMKLHPDWDVVALTGDTANLGRPQADAALDGWPQSHRFAVPGNHDNAETYTTLSRWQTQAPWVETVRTVCFVGLNSCDPLRDQAKAVAQLVELAPPALLRVILMHHPPRILGGALGDFLTVVYGRPEMSRPTLVLHGHDHPRPFRGTWGEDASLGAGWTASISHVCSCAVGRRGAAHFITWDGNHLACDRRYVRGDSTAAAVEQPDAADERRDG